MAVIGDGKGLINGREQGMTKGWWVAPSTKAEDSVDWCETEDNVVENRGESGGEGRRILWGRWRWMCDCGLTMGEAEDGIVWWPVKVLDWNPNTKAQLNAEA